MELPQSSIAARTRRRQKKKWSGKIMAVLCAVILSAGVAWLYSHAGPDLNRDREAQSAPDTKLPAKVISNAQIGVPEEVRRAVLLYFEENKERLRSQLIEIEFSASSAGLEVSLLAGTQSMLYRVPIDSDLREWYDDHFTELQRPRMRMLEQSISNFFKGWDVAIRNQTNIEDFQSYRNSVGLTALVGALGYHLTAIVANDKYPCVYEDRNAVYFLLPRGTRRFQVTGTEIDERLSGFPGTFQVQVQSGKKKTDSESAAKTAPAPDDSGAETDPPGK